MDNYTATELAYKNGYEQGKKDAVKHGHWLKTEEPLGWNEVDCVECSACRDSWIANEDYGLDFADFWKYCPSCGARMNGE
ncbi:MAG: hypothetical protein IKU94_00795 [Bacteroidaceae bacterium]|nr:hypothetical protein [Bacteroidaceae bacterium]MBR4930426.1 hypothetical protein [Bacteroidaceae bacterium]